MESFGIKETSWLRSTLESFGIKKGGIITFFWLKSHLSNAPPRILHFGLLGHLQFYITHGLTLT